MHQHPLKPVGGGGGSLRPTSSAAYELHMLRVQAAREDQKLRKASTLAAVTRADKERKAAMQALAERTRAEQALWRSPARASAHRRTTGRGGDSHIQLQDHIIINPNTTTQNPTVSVVAMTWRAARSSMVFIAVG